MLLILMVLLFVLALIRFFAFSHVEATNTALVEAFNWTSSNANYGRRIFISDQNMWRAIQGFDVEICWRLEQNISEIKQIIDLLIGIQIDLIP